MMIRQALMTIFSKKILWAGRDSYMKTTTDGIKESRCPMDHTSISGSMTDITSFKVFWGAETLPIIHEK